MDPLKKLLVFLIAAITMFTRFYHLDLAPPHLSNDEISIAYDAYSIASTAKDEYGNFLPLSFPSHGTYKAPLYAYFLAPLTLIYPGNAVTARLPSAIAGSLTVLFLVLLTYELTGSLSSGLWAGLILAVTPWHIYSSRMALEANLALLFLTSGLWAILYGFTHKKWFIFAGFFSLAVSMYGYHTQWGLVPLLVIGILVFYRRHFRVLFYASILLSIVSLPLGLNFAANLGTTARANTELIWKDGQMQKKLNGFGISSTTKFLMIGKAFASNYFDYLNPGALFTQGLGLFNSGHIYIQGLWLVMFLPFYVFGFSRLNREIKPVHQGFSWWWLVVTPIVPALTHGGFNHVRYLVAVVPFTIVIALGWNYAQKQIQTFWRLILNVTLALSFIFFCFLYYQHFPIHSGLNYQYGYRQAAEYLSKLNLSGKNVIVDPRFGENSLYIGVPHLYLAYFMKLDPRILQNRVYEPGAMHFGNFTIKEINWNQQAISPNALYLVPESNLPISSNLTQLYKIDLPDGTSAFRIYRSDP